MLHFWNEWYNKLTRPAIAEAEPWQEGMEIATPGPSGGFAIPVVTANNFVYVTVGVGKDGKVNVVVERALDNNNKQQDKLYVCFTT